MYFIFEPPFALMTALHTLGTFNQLHEVVTWNAFQLTCVPCCDKVVVVYET